MAYIREDLLASMDLGSSSTAGVSSAAIQRRVPPGPLDAGGSEPLQSCRFFTLRLGTIGISDHQVKVMCPRRQVPGYI